MKYYKMKLVKGSKNAKNPPKPITKKKLAKYITVAILVLSLIGVTLYEKYSYYEEEVNISNNTELFPLRVSTIRKYFSKCSTNCFSYSSPCSISCKNVIFPDDLEDIYFNLQQAKDENLIECDLVFEAAQFQNQFINKNWIKITNETFPKIIKLEISSSDLRFMGPESLSNFSDLQKLCLGKLNLTSLHKNGFSGLPNLTYLSIWEMNNLKYVEYAFLSNFPKLEMLEFSKIRTANDLTCSNLNIQLFANLTGNYTAKNVETVAFGNNCLQNITRDILNGYPNAIQIFLNLAAVTRFEEESLKNLTRLSRLDIEYNDITTLPENVFKNFFENNRAVQIMIDGNDLECDCEMKWLQDYIIGRGGSLVEDFKNIRCHNFPQDITFLEADMCPDNNMTTDGSGFGSPGISTNPPDTTLHTTTMPPETSPVNYSSTPSTASNFDNVTNPDGSPTDAPDDDDQPVVIKCKPQSKIAKSRIIRSAFPYIRLHLPITKTDESDLVFTLAPKQQYFNISDYDGTTINVTFNNNNKYSGRSILWLTYEDNNFLQNKKQPNPIATSCSTNIFKKWYLIQNLEPAKSYLICVFDDIEFNVNLLDCVPHTTQQLVENQAWLTFASKPMAIVILVFVSIGAFAVGSAILYALVRNNPTLIKGSKKVIVVKRQDKQQVMIMPGDYKNFKNDSIGESSDKCNSDTCSVVSYISAIQPSPMEILAYRLERLRAKNQEESGGKMANLSLPPSSSESFTTSSPRTSIKTIISTDTIYENDFEL